MCSLILVRVLTSFLNLNNPSSLRVGGFSVPYFSGVTHFTPLRILFSSLQPFSLGKHLNHDLVWKKPPFETTASGGAISTDLGWTWSENDEFQTLKCVHHHTAHDAAALNFPQTKSLGKSSEECKRNKRNHFLTPPICGVSGFLKPSTALWCYGNALLYIFF